jgi:hypothetical protein
MASVASPWELVPVVLGSVLQACFAMVCSREPVPFVLLVSSLYRKLVLLFLIYILLTFDQKKKKERAFLLPILLLSYVRSFLHASHDQSNIGASIPATRERAMDLV